MQWLAETHFTVLAISLRAHGDSTGEINDFGWSARRDVTAAVAFLQRECPGSRSTSSVARWAERRRSSRLENWTDRVAGYFLEQPYKDLKSAAWNRLQHYLPPVLDWLAYGGLRLWAPAFLPVDPDCVSPYDHVQEIPENVPVVFIAGSADRHARLEDVKVMCGQIESHAQMIVFEGATHEPLDQYDPRLYRTTLFAFLEGRQPRPGPPKDLGSLRPPPSPRGLTRVVCGKRPTATISNE